MNNKIAFIRSKQLAAVDYAYASRVPSDMDLLFLAAVCREYEGSIERE